MPAGVTVEPPVRDLLVLDGRQLRHAPGRGELSHLRVGELRPQVVGVQLRADVVRVQLRLLVGGRVVVVTRRRLRLLLSPSPVQKEGGRGERPGAGYGSYHRPRDGAPGYRRFAFRSGR